MLARYGVEPWTVTPRRLRVLIQALPPGLWADPDSPMSWSVEAHLLAGTIDAVNQVAWLTAATNSKRPPPRPKPVDRPGSRRQRRGMSVGALGRMLAKGAGDGR